MQKYVTLSENHVTKHCSPHDCLAELAQSFYHSLVSAARTLHDCYLNMNLIYYLTIHLFICRGVYFKLTAGSCHCT